MLRLSETWLAAAIVRFYFHQANVAERAGRITLDYNQIDSLVPGQFGIEDFVATQLKRMSRQPLAKLHDSTSPDRLRPNGIRRQQGMINGGSNRGGDRGHTHKSLVKDPADHDRDQTMIHC